MAEATYAAVTDLRPRINKTDDGDDPWLFELLEAAALLIDEFCNRVRADGLAGYFVADTTASARYYMGSGKTYQLIDECIAITEVAVKDSASDTDYTAWDTPTTNLAGDGDWIAFSGFPRNPNFNALPYDAIQIDVNGTYSYFVGGQFGALRGFRPIQTTARYVPTVRVTARWGYAASVPRIVQEACLMQAAIIYKKFQASGANVLAQTEFGTLEMARGLDGTVELLLVGGRLVKPAIGGAW